MIGQLLDRRYLITQSLSSGGFGETYLAQDTRIPGNPFCVVKQLKPASNNPGHIEKAKQLFNREAEALAKLGNHDQIPRLLAYFTEGDDFYLVQEFIAGHTLEKELELGQLWSEQQVIQLLEEVLTVLTFVHAQGVIHRDIKPANIIRRERDNKLVLIDFGAIKQVRIQPDGSGEFSAVSPGTRIGTIGYMPTEQARGKPRPSSDLYALGMIAIQALTGRHPTRFEDDSQTGEANWQPLIQASPGLIYILRQMTRYHFRDRYQTATDALQAVQQLALGRDPTAISTPIPMPEHIPELTLEWVETGQFHNQVISPQPPSRHPGTVRIGRDPSRCDIVLSDITVSGLHVEIFFNSQDQHFYVRNLRETNPPIVDGQSLPQGEQRLNQGSTLQLGQMELRVTAITVKPYPPRYSPGYPPGYPPIGHRHVVPRPSPIASINNAEAAVVNPPPPVPPGYRQESPHPQPAAAPAPLPGESASPVSPPSGSPIAAAYPPQTQPDWKFWLWWLLATAIGSTIGASGFYLQSSVMSGAIAGALLGGCTGGAQWLVLRQWLPSRVGWIPTSAIAGAIGLAPVSVFPALRLIIGLPIGIGQWLILRDALPQAVWWIVAKAIADPIALLVGFALAQTNYLLVGAIAGLISGSITGAVLLWLLRQVRPLKANP